MWFISCFKHVFIQLPGFLNVFLARFNAKSSVVLFVARVLLRSCYGALDGCQGAAICL